MRRGTEEFILKTSIILFLQQKLEKIEQNDNLSHKRRRLLFPALFPHENHPSQIEEERYESHLDKKAY